MARDEVFLFVDNEELRLTRNGVWLTNGQEITHESTIRGFMRHLRREDGRYVIRIARESKPVTVEDTAYFVTNLRGSAEAGYELVLNDGTSERLDPATLAYQPARLTCRIAARASASSGGAFEEAKFLSAPYFEILQGLRDDGQSYYLQIGDQKVTLAPVTGSD